MPTPLSYHHAFSPAPGAGRGTLLLLHGTGGNERDLLPLGRQLDPEAALLSPLGDVDEHGQARFFRRFAEGVFDLDDLERRTHALAEFINGAAARYGLDSARITAVGYSNGANIAASLLLLRPKSLAAAILLRPMLPFQPAAPPALPSTPVLILSGQADPIVPAESAQALAALLARSGARVTREEVQAGHGLSARDFSLAREWLLARRTPDPAP